MFLHGRELKSLQLFGHAVPAKVHRRQPTDLDARSPFVWGMRSISSTAPGWRLCAKVGIPGFGGMPAYVPSRA